MTAGKRRARAAAHNELRLALTTAAGVTGFRLNLPLASYLRKKLA